MLQAGKGVALFFIYRETLTFWFGGIYIYTTEKAVFWGELGVTFYEALDKEGKKGSESCYLVRGNRVENFKNEHKSVEPWL